MLWSREVGDRETPSALIGCRGRGSDGQAVDTLGCRVIETSSWGVRSWTRELSTVLCYADFQTCLDHEPVVRNHCALCLLLWCVHTSTPHFTDWATNMLACPWFTRPCQQKRFLQCCHSCDLAKTRIRKRVVANKNSKMCHYFKNAKVWEIFRF